MKILTIEEQMIAIENLIYNQGISGILGHLYCLTKIRYENNKSSIDLLAYNRIIEDAINKTKIIEIASGEVWGKHLPLEV